MAPNVVTLIDEPTYVADIDSLIANWVHQHHDRPEQSGQPESSYDKKASVRRIWEVLNDPDRPCDHISVDNRVEMIRYLERLFRTEIRNKAQLEELVTGFLGDGRCLPATQAVKRARKKLKLSQRQLAVHLGLKDHTLISKIESGKREPSAKVIEWLHGIENVTAKRPVKGKSRTPRIPVTSIRGNEASIPPDSGKSVTSPKQPECPSAEANTLPPATSEQGSIFPPDDLPTVTEAPTTPTAPEADGSSPSTGEDSNV